MAIKFVLVAFLAALTCVIADEASNYLDIEPPSFFSYNSPLRQPDSLRSRPYFDFLSTLYRRDVDKTNLFRPYTRTRRDTVTHLAPVPHSGAASYLTPQQIQQQQQQQHSRVQRAVVFRPLFVYRQQQIKRKRINRTRV